MIGTMNLPIAKGNAKTYIFTTPDASNSFANEFRSMQKWEKPKGINFVYGMLINAGCGGGGGFGGAAAGGGGGGASGNSVQFLQPAYLVPDTLYVTVAKGGLGGAAGAVGGLITLSTGLWYSPAGVNIFNSVRPYYAFPGTTPTSNQSGRNGTNAAGGAGGIAYTAGSATSVPGISLFSNFIFAASTAGTAGGFSGAGSPATINGRPIGGTGGGGLQAGVATSGGAVINVQPSAQSIYGTAGTIPGGATFGSAGVNGYTLFEPTFFSTPGTGGGGNASGTGGRGGNGGIGCGGGGGGGGSVTGGAGGNGGDGLVILVCW